MSREGLPTIIVHNMTDFFNRELFMRSLGDIRFKKPISLRRVAYTTIFFIAWTLPMFLIFGIILNVFFIAIAVAPPFILGYFASKPVWGGRSLMDFIKVNMRFMTEPKGWTDLEPNNRLNNDRLFVEDEIWISRRRELQLLADLREEKEEQKILKIQKKVEV